MKDTLIVTPRALWTIGTNTLTLRDAELPRDCGGMVTLTALYSGVSRGTEALVARGGVPDSERDRMRCPNQEGDFPFPVKYGYALVGKVTEGPDDRLGQTCFALHPHQTRARLHASATLPLPDGLPPRRAVLAANMETAVNVTWDSGAGAGDRVLVVGAGVVGLLVAHVIARIPGTQVTVCDLNPDRATLAETMGATFSLPGAAPDGQDIVINTSASAAGLRLALDAAGQEATVVEASWHGAGDVALPLGGPFHARRLTLRSSQVGDLPPARKPRWDYARRLTLALRLLRDAPWLDALLTHDIPFDDAPDLLPALLAPGADALCPVITYP
jgi:threonine dehydrogenase-like Zn-dependent dehydrogenase